MSNINLTVRPGQPAADWASQNPVLQQFEIGFESDTGYSKVNLSPTATAWNSLGYFNKPPIVIKTTRVQTNVGTKQALLSAVPAGKKRIVIMQAFRNVSQSLAAYNDDTTCGFNADANDGGDWLMNPAIVNLTDATKCDVSTGSGIRVVGTAGDVWGFKSLDTSINATVDIDVHYYDLDA